MTQDHRPTTGYSASVRVVDNSTGEARLAMALNSTNLDDIASMLTGAAVSLRPDDSDLAPLADDRNAPPLIWVRDEVCAAHSNPSVRDNHPGDAYINPESVSAITSVPLLAEAGFRTPHCVILFFDGSRMLFHRPAYDVASDLGMGTVQIPTATSPNGGAL